MTKLIKWMCAQWRLKTSLGIRPVRRRKTGSLATHWVQSEDSDQTGRMPRLIRVFARAHANLLVLSWSGSYYGAFELAFDLTIIHSSFKIELKARSLCSCIHVFTLSIIERMYNHFETMDFIHWLICNAWSSFSVQKCSLHYISYICKMLNWNVYLFEISVHNVSVFHTKRFSYLFCAHETLVCANVKVCLEFHSRHCYL